MAWSRRPKSAWGAFAMNPMRYVRVGLSGIGFVECLEQPAIVPAHAATTAATQTDRCQERFKNGVRPERRAMDTPMRRALRRPAEQYHADEEGRCSPPYSCGTREAGFDPW
jgi:hypothetical protein